MKKQSLLLASLLVLGSVMTSNAQSYEGHISETIPATSKLMLSDGKTLNAELTEYADEGSKKPKLVYLYAEKNILSLSFAWETMGAYLSSGTIYHTFDLANNKEISLLNEINPEKLSALKSKIQTAIQKKLDEHRKNYTEQEWIDAFGDKETFEKAFKLSESEKNLLENWYLKPGFLTVLFDNYFDFPHVIQAMDFSGEWKSSFPEIRQYLKENSILNNLQ